MKKCLTVLLCLCLLLCSLPLPSLAGSAEEILLLFTHDIHSHLEETLTAEGLSGGLGRLKTLIDEARAEGPEATFLMDAGDFSMGTLYQTIYETHAAELTLLGRLGYDATTFGNHEFEYRGAGLANMLRAAVRNAQTDPTLTLPAVVSCNIDWDKSTDATALDVRAAMDEYGVMPYTVIERGGARVGVFGMLGEDGVVYAPLSGLTFKALVESAKAAVSALQKENVDLIVCLSHSGTWDDASKSEDDLLAKAVPEIDVIVSGHTHTVLEKYHRHGSTYIVSAGCYTDYLGELWLSRNASGRWDVSLYELRPASADVAIDASVDALLNEYRRDIDNEYLSQFGYAYGQPLCENAVDLGSDADVQSTHGESALGNLISDAYVDAVKKAEGDAYRKVDFAIVPSGVIRGTLGLGTLTTNDAFNVISLGIGKDRVPGYPLISVYLTGKELFDVAEVDASITSLMGGVELFPSGGGWEYNANRLILNRVTRVWVNEEGGAAQEVESDRLYRVVVDLYCGQMLGTVNSKSFGLLSIAPKDEQGRPVTDFEARILYDAQGREVKEWAALAGYLADMGTVPERYAAAEGRKLVSDSKALGDLLKTPHKIFWVLVLVIVALIALIVGIVLLVRRRARRRKARANAK